MEEFKFNRVDNKEKNTINIYVENAVIDIKKEDYKIVNRIKNKYDRPKADIIILNKEIKNKLKIWEIKINDYLKKCELGVNTITLLYGNKIYPNVLELLIKLEEEILQLKIRSIWINEDNKAFVQLYYIHYT